MVVETLGEELASSARAFVRRHAVVRGSRLRSAARRVGFAAVVLVGCANEVVPAPRANPDAGASSPPRAQAGSPAAFDGDRAYRDLVSLVDRGQRHFGAPRRGEAIAHLEELLGAVAQRVERQTFEAVEPVSGARGELVNLVARWRAEEQRRVLLGSHWDTRRWAEEDPDPSRRSDPIPGANDGTSGVVVLFEVLRVLDQRRDLVPGLGVDVVLFDGEELGTPQHPSSYCLGSRHFAATIEELYPGGRPVASIILDMVGDRDLGLRREASSSLRAPWLNDLVWSAGAARAPARFLDGIGPTVEDDHTALLRIGLPAVLLADLEYEFWHTHADTPDRVSADSLATVGTVLLDVIDALTATTSSHRG